MSLRVSRLFLQIKTKRTNYISPQQRSGAGYHPFRRSPYSYAQAKRSTKSVDEESCDGDYSRPRLLDNARYKHISRIPECRSFDRDISGFQNPTRSFSPDHISSNVPLTRGYLAAANRNLAASTLKLWQSGDSNKKTRSSYNLNDCEEV